jgi:hypothetical protein
MRIDDNSFNHTKSVMEYNVSSFAGNAGKRGELLHGRGDLAAEIFDELPPHTLEALGFIAEEAGGMNDLFQLLAVGLGVVGGGGKLLVETGGDLVDLLVSGLSREDGGDQELEGRIPVESSGGVGIAFAQTGHDLLGASAAVS